MQQIEHTTLTGQSVPRDTMLDRVTGLACRLFDTPTALVSVVDGDRLWFRSRAGWAGHEHQREGTFCSHAIQDDTMLVVPDAARDERFHGHPWVIGEAGIRFYAGQPLSAGHGKRVGTLCVMDRMPRQFDNQQRSDLGALTRLVERELNLQELADAHMELKGELEDSHRERMVDPDLDTLNRSALNRILPGERSRAKREGSSLMLALLDLTEVRVLDDNLSTSRAKQLLSHAVQAIRGAIRPYDHLGHWSGQVFALVCPKVCSSFSQGIVERVQQEVAFALATFQGENAGLLAPAGVVTCDFAKSDASHFDLVEAASAALAESRLAGGPAIRLRVLS